MRMFLRKTRLEREPLAVTMSGVRLGEKALQIGEGDVSAMTLIASKTGLTGTAAIVVLDEPAAARVRRVMEDAGALADVGVVDQGPSPELATFDVVVVHDVRHTIASSDNAIRSGWLQLCLRVLREGGRLVTIEPGRPVGIRSLFAGSQQDGETGPGGETGAILTAAGFRNVRLLGDSEGLRFVEAMKAN
jgi:SAM-dependent methyltransferase